MDISYGSFFGPDPHSAATWDTRGEPGNYLAGGIRPMMDLASELRYENDL